MQKSKVKMGIYVSWFILSLFYLYQYILRVSPGVLIDEIRRDFHINADEFALFGSLFYAGYSLMQIPIGVLMDKVGIRKTTLFSIALCVCGTFLLISTDDPVVAYVSRLIAGIGAASSFMSILKLSNDYMPANIRGIAIGAALTAGSIGALITGAPLNYLLEHVSSWQVAFGIFVGLGAIIWVFAMFCLPKQQKDTKATEVKNDGRSIKDNLMKILKSKPIMIYAIIAVGLYAPLSVMGDLWGTSFLIKKFSMNRGEASSVLMNIYIGMAIGSIILPYLAEKYNILNKIILFAIVILLALFIVLIYVPHLNQVHLLSLILLIGFFCGAETLCFNAALRYTDSHTSGLTIGVVNTLNMAGGAIMQQAIGVYLDATWQGSLDINGLRIYSLQEFVEAFSILVIILFICAIIACTALSKNKKFGI